MPRVLKMLITAAAVIFISQDATAQYERPPRPPLPPGMKYDTIRRKDADNWEFVQVKMPGKGPYTEVFAEGSYHNGFLEGTWIDYWETQAIHQIIFFTHGKKNGIAITADPVGGIEKTESYKDDLLEGPTRIYTPHSGILLEETYYSQGKKHGKHTKWYPNHVLQEEGNYVNGNLEGVAYWYYDDGKKSVEYTYHNGSLEGNATVYYRNDMASDMGPYEKNVQSGHWKEFYENGNLKEEGDYVKGEKEGMWKQYDEQGKFVQNVKYKKGELQKK